MADINLIPQESKKSDDFEKLRGKIVIVSIIVLVLTALAAIVTLAFFAYRVSQRENLLSRVQEASTTVNSYKENEELIVVTKDKSAISSRILGARLDMVNVFTTLAQIIPKNVYFTDFKITSADIQINGRAGSSAEIAGLISALLSTEGARIVSNVSINSLVSDETGAYTFGLVAKVK